MMYAYRRHGGDYHDGTDGRLPPVDLETHLLWAAPQPPEGGEGDFTSYDGAPPRLHHPRRHHRYLSKTRHRLPAAGHRGAPSTRRGESVSLFTSLIN